MFLSERAAATSGSSFPCASLPRLCVNMLYVEPGDEVLCDYMFEDWDPDMVTPSLPTPLFT